MTLDEFLEEWRNDSPTLEVRTSGSTGAPKTMLVEKSRMAASARATCRHLSLKEGDTALLCMPLDYIAGKMMVVRALTCGLKLVSVKPDRHPLASLTNDASIDFAAMVPMQVYGSLQVKEEKERLSSVRHLIIGGGSIDASLEKELSGLPNSVWSTYGMTETLSHIALRRVNGPDRSLWYTPLDGVEVRLNEEGCLVVDAPCVCKETLTTNDIAELSTADADATGKPRFRIVGRKDNTISSGGIKIQLEEVEQKLRPVIHDNFALSWRSDKEYGQMLVMLTEGDAEQAEKVCRKVLPRYHVPKQYIKVAAIPQTPTGKTARAEAHKMAEENKALF